MSFRPINKIVDIFKKQLPDFNFYIIDVEKQIEKAAKDIEQCKQKTLSLDVYVKGDYNLEISRLFNIGDGQLKATGFTTRPEKPENHICELDPIDYTLIEDDIASGQTFVICFNLLFLMVVISLNKSFFLIIPTINT